MSLADFFPSDLMMGHLQRTWLYWLLVILLLVEFVWMAPRVRHYLAETRALRSASAGPWTKDSKPSRVIPLALMVQMAIGGGVLVCLLLTTALAYYVVAVGLLTAFVRMLDQLPDAHGGEAIGTVIGGWIGASIQVLLIMGAIASVDPTSTFPLRLDAHLSERLAQ